MLDFSKECVLMQITGGYEDETDTEEEEEEGVHGEVILGNSHQEPLTCSFVNSISC